MPDRQGSPPTRGRGRGRGRLVTLAVVVVGLVIVALLLRVALELPAPAEERLASASGAPELAPARPVKPFAVDGARALPARLPPLPEVEPRSGALPELEVRGVATHDEGHVTWLDDPVFEDILYDAERGRSDGASVYYTRGGDRDLLIRGGELYTDVARQLGVEPSTRRCVDVRHGRFLFVAADDAEALTAWLFESEGPIVRIDLGMAAERSFGCEAYVQESGGFVVQADARAIWDGERITHAVATRGLLAPTPFNTSVACTPACTPYERAPATADFAAGIEAALACEEGIDLQLVGPWLLGRCVSGGRPLARAALDGPCCDHALLPRPPGLTSATLTRAGDVALRYVDGSVDLWTVDGALSPRQPPSLDLMITRPPALQLRGLPAIKEGFGLGFGGARPPWAGMPWLDRIRGGSSYDAEAALRATKPAFPRERAATVANDWVAPRDQEAGRSSFGEALELRAQGLNVVDLRCGHVLWGRRELMLGGGESYSSTPTRAPKCQPLADFATVSEFSFDPTDATLLARDPRGQLLIAWRPASMRSPDDPEFDPLAHYRLDAPPPPAFHGWTALGVRGALDDGAGWRSLSGVASVRVDDLRLVVDGDQIYTLPLDAEPLEIDQGRSLLAAHGERVIACTPRCVSIDPGLGRPVTAAALLGTAPLRLLVRDGAAYGLVHLDAPREALPEHRLAEILRAQFDRRDRERDELRTEYAAWVSRVMSGVPSEYDEAKLTATREAFAKHRAEYKAEREAAAARAAAAREAFAKQMAEHRAEREAAATSGAAAPP